MANPNPDPSKVTLTVCIVPPFGYRLVNGRLEIDPEQARKIRAYFREYAQTGKVTFK